VFECDIVTDSKEIELHVKIKVSDVYKSMSKISSIDFLSEKESFPEDVMVDLISINIDDRYNSFQTTEPKSIPGANPEPLQKRLIENYPACKCPIGTGWSAQYKHCSPSSVTSCDDCPLLVHCDSGHVTNKANILSKLVTI
jgi:hypothetical protein